MSWIREGNEIRKSLRRLRKELRRLREKEKETISQKGKEEIRIKDFNLLLVSKIINNSPKIFGSIGNSKLVSRCLGKEKEKGKGLKRFGEED
jgi:hypothetical protein